IGGRNNVRALDYQDHGSFRRTCAMAHAFGHDEVLIDVFVFMPVIFAFKHRHLTTESFTLQSVWLYHLSLQASASFCTSINSSGPCRMFRYVLYGNSSTRVFAAIRLNLPGSRVLQIQFPAFVLHSSPSK